MNNHVRNAFSHLARIQHINQIEEIQKEADCAIAHIERANRDCLKAAIIYARGRLDDLILEVHFHHGTLTPALETQFKRLVQERKQAYITETRGDGAQTEKLETILRLTEHLSDQIKQHYQEAGSRLTPLQRRMKRWFRPINLFVTLLLGTAFGVVIRPHVDQWFSRLFQ
ncbi:MAG: hypothetical protein H7834_08165 [Magnetococcus sp. YQC-9]